MFGYILVNKPELKIREFERYHAFYCGLCRELKNRYGLPGQMTLSYDLTFLAILLNALYEPEENEGTTRCVFHPAARHPVIQSRYTAFAADMNVLLAYHKAQDDRLDEKKPSALLSSGSLKSAYQNIVNLYPEKCRIVSSELKRIHRLEAENSTDTDKISGCFGRIMAEVFPPAQDEWTDHLKRFGFYLGKYIYLLDAYDDIEKDCRTGNYNPLKNIWNNDRKSFRKSVRPILTIMISEAAGEFEMLPVLRDKELLRNILYSGVWSGFYIKGKKKPAFAPGFRKAEPENPPK